jgi:hypothetical protein
LSLAEKHFKEAIWMVPKLLGNRFALFQFYCQTKDTADAIYWGQSILALPEKVASEKAKAIKKQTMQMLTSLK